MKTLLLLTLFSKLFALDFREMLKLYLSKDPDFKAIELQNEYYKKRYYQGVSEFTLPNVTFSQTHTTIEDSSLNQTNSQYASLGVNFDLFKFGADFAQMNSFEYDYLAQLEKSKGRLLSSERNIARILLDYVRSKTNVSILEDLYKTKLKVLEFSKKRYRSGRISKNDYLSVKIDTSNSKTELDNAKRSFRESIAEIVSYGVDQRLEGYPWSGKINSKLIDRLLEIPVTIEQIPAYKEASFNFLAAKSFKAQLKREMFGTVSLSFQRDLYYNATEDYGHSLALSYTLPLFDQYSRYSNFERARAQYKAQKVAQDFQKNKGQFAIKNQRPVLSLSYSNFKETAETVGLSKSIFDNAVDRFKKGNINVNDLLVEQGRYLRTKQLANESSYQIHLALFDFCHSRAQSVTNGCLESM